MASVYPLLYYLCEKKKKKDFRILWWRHLDFWGEIGGKKEGWRGDM